MATPRLLAGLMHNVGRIYILTRASKYPTLIADPLTYQSIVRDWHTNVAKALLENWQVADEIVDAVGGHEDMDREVRGPVTLTDVLALAIAAASSTSARRAQSTPDGIADQGRSSACRCSCAIVTACSTSPRKKSRRSRPRSEDKGSCPRWHSEPPPSRTSSRMMPRRSRRTWRRYSSGCVGVAARRAADRHAAAADAERSGRRHSAARAGHQLRAGAGRPRAADGELRRAESDAPAGHGPEDRR